VKGQFNGRGLVICTLGVVSVQEVMWCEVGTVGRGYW